MCIVALLAWVEDSLCVCVCVCLPTQVPSNRRFCPRRAHRVLVEGGVCAQPAQRQAHTGPERVAIYGAVHGVQRGLGHFDFAGRLGCGERPRTAAEASFPLVRFVCCL